MKLRFVISSYGNNCGPMPEREAKKFVERHPGWTLGAEAILIEDSGPTVRFDESNSAISGDNF